MSSASFSKRTPSVLLLLRRCHQAPLGGIPIASNGAYRLRPPGHAGRPQPFHRSGAKKREERHFRIIGSNPKPGCAVGSVRPTTVPVIAAKAEQHLGYCGSPRSRSPLANA
jgi:hypothetical protein